MLLGTINFAYAQDSSCIVKSNKSYLYVSSSLGSDNNLGKIDSPLKTIAKALALSTINTSVRLKCGDTFYENFSTKNNIESYGAGNKPIICGFKRIAMPAWINVKGNIWKLDLLAATNFSGFVGSTFNHNNIGLIHEFDTDETHGHKVKTYTELVSNFDFWQTEKHLIADIALSDFRYLYMYLDSDPNLLKLEFSVGVYGAIANNCNISNIKFEGWGTCGISAGSNLNIENVDIDMIGGSVQIGYPSWVRFGNGVEFWISAGTYNAKVEHCEISRVYDCGTTIQGSRSTGAPTNIIFRKNIIKNCRQAFESFLRNGNSNLFNNCVFEKNICLDSGNNGFQSPEGRDAHLLSNDTDGDRGMIIKGNLFVGGNYFCAGVYNGEYKTNKFYANTVYLTRGCYLLSNRNYTDIVRIPTDVGNYKTIDEATNAAIESYRKKTGDLTTSFIIVSNDELTKYSRLISIH